MKVKEVDAAINAIIGHVRLLERVRDNLAENLTTEDYDIISNTIEAGVNIGYICRQLLDSSDLL